MTKQPRACRKIRYKDEIAARVALARTTRADGSRREKREQRAYRCTTCRGWHLTSKK